MMMKMMNTFDDEYNDEYDDEYDNDCNDEYNDEYEVGTSIMMMNVNMNTRIRMMMNTRLAQISPQLQLSHPQLHLMACCLRH